MEGSHKSFELQIFWTTKEERIEPEVIFRSIVKLKDRQIKEWILFPYCPKNIVLLREMPTDKHIKRIFVIDCKLLSTLSVPMMILKKYISERDQEFITERAYRSYQEENID